VFPVRTDIHSFLRENSREVNIPSFQYYGNLKNIVGGISIFNVALAGLLL